MSAAPNQWFLFVKIEFYRRAKNGYSFILGKFPDFFFILRNYEFADPYSPFNCQESPTIEP